MRKLRSGQLRGTGPFKERLRANPYRRRLRRIFQRPEVVGWGNLPQERGQGPCFEVFLCITPGQEDAAAWARQLGLPETIDGYPVVYGWSEPASLAAWVQQDYFWVRPDARTVPINEPYTEDTDTLALRAYADPMHSGLEIFSANSQRVLSRGATLSGIVYDAETGQPLLLSCAHVIARGHFYNEAALEEVGHPIYQPRYPDLAGNLLRWGTLDDPDDVNIDAAVATIAPGRTVRDGYYGPYGAVAKAEPVVPQVHDTVVITGRSTGQTTADVYALDYTVTIDGITFTGLIRVYPDTGVSGDSGSLVYLAGGDQNIVGIFIGTSFSTGLVLPAALIEEDLGVTFMPSVITGAGATGRRTMFWPITPITPLTGWGR